MPSLALGVVAEVFQGGVAEEAEAPPVLVHVGVDAALPEEAVAGLQEGGAQACRGGEGLRKG